MKVIETFSAWFFTLFGVLLIGLSVLVAPDRLFAKGFDGDPCTESCCWAMFGTTACTSNDPAFTPCVSDCKTCVGNCGCDQGCIDNCSAQVKQCPGDDCEKYDGQEPLCFLQWQVNGSCDGLNTFCNKINGCLACRCVKVVGSPNCKCKTP